MESKNNQFATNYESDIAHKNKAALYKNLKSRNLLRNEQKGTINGSSKVVKVKPIKNLNKTLDDPQAAYKTQ